MARKAGVSRNQWVPFGADIDAGITLPTTVANEVIIVGGADGALTRRATTAVNPQTTYLPLGLRSRDD
jgi:hypothetical protein